MEEYSRNNFEFISISTDEITKDINTWKSVIKNKCIAMENNYSIKIGIDADRFFYKRIPYKFFD